MPWVRIDEEFAHHPKVVKAGPLGMAIQIAALCYCNRYLTDGFVPRSVAATLLDFSGLGMRMWMGELAGGGQDATWELVVADLEDAGLWERVEGGWRIHDYHVYQPSREQVLAERERNRLAGQKGGLARRKRTTRRSAKPSASATSTETPSGSPSTVLGEPQANRRAKTQARTRTPVVKGEGMGTGGGSGGRTTHPSPQTAASPSSAIASGDADSAAEPPDPTPSLHVVASDRPPPPKLSAQLRAGNGEVPDAAKEAADAALGPGWRERVRPNTDTDPAEFEAERQRQIAAIRDQFGEHFAPEFEHEPSAKPTEIEHEVNTNRDDSEHGTSTG